MSDLTEVGARPFGAASAIGLARRTTLLQAMFARRPGYLFSPCIDFLCLGGGSLIVLPMLWLLLPQTPENQSIVALIAMGVAHLVNHPHFAHSYQLFYRDFSRKLLGQEYAPRLRLRYAVAGLMVPVGMGGLLAVGVLTQSMTLLGHVVNGMMLLVGWHYVKQGYGMIIVDSVLKRQFLTDSEKRLLRVNGYCCWALAWLLVNHSFSERELWGMAYHSFPLPLPVLIVGAVAALASTVAVLWALGRRWLASGSLPLNGVVAYFTTLYAWTVFVSFDPLWLLVVPAFHSLQYLVVVWRYELNLVQQRAAAAPAERRTAVAGLLSFLMIGFVAGYLGFWGLPGQLDSAVPYETAVFGPTLFMFIFWIFINVHHYFIDNVIWRGENPDTRRYLFGR